VLRAGDVERIEARLRAYLAAFEKGDAEAYADQFVFPAAIWASGAWTGVPDRRACLELVRGYTAHVNDLGAVRGRILEMNVIELLPRVAVNQLRYQRLGAGGQVVENVRASYLMLEQDGEWRIATIAGESEPA
jgi:ketosteroid isomerase-like protein